MVERNGPVIPVWDEFVTPEVRARMKLPPAAQVGSEPISGDYLHHLASSGAFQSFAAIRTFLVREVSRRRELAADGVRLYPDAIREHLYGLPPDIRHDIARLESTYPAPSVKTEADGRLGLTVNRETEDGKIFAELLALEHGHNGGRVDGAAKRITVRGKYLRLPRQSAGRLGFREDETLAVSTWWDPVPASAEIVVLAGEQVSARKSFDPGDASTGGVTIEPGDRPRGNRVILLRVEATGDAPISSVYWQRTEPGG